MDLSNAVAMAESPEFTASEFAKRGPDWQLHFQYLHRTPSLKERHHSMRLLLDDERHSRRVVFDDGIEHGTWEWVNIAAVDRSDRSVDRAIGSIDSIDSINFRIFIKSQGARDLSGVKVSDLYDAWRPQKC